MIELLQFWRSVFEAFLEVSYFKSMYSFMHPLEAELNSCCSCYVGIVCRSTQRKHLHVCWATAILKLCVWSCSWSNWSQDEQYHIATGRLTSCCSCYVEDVCRSMQLEEPLKTPGMLMKILQFSHFLKLLQLSCFWVLWRWCNNLKISVEVAVIRCCFKMFGLKATGEMDHADYLQVLRKI